MKTFSVSFLSALFALVLMAGAFAPTAAAGDSVNRKECATKVAACGKCGDGYCAKQCGETAESCPADCGVVERRLLACAKCGDGVCAIHCENAQSCPKDCGVSTTSIVSTAGH